MTDRDTSSIAQASPDLEELAAQAFQRRQLGQWSRTDEAEMQARMSRDPDFADAYRRVEESWTSVGKHATSAEMMRIREQAISRARRTSAQRWRESNIKSRAFRAAAVFGALAIALGAAYQFAPFGLKPGEYRTDIGEQRVVELPDHSRIALDAATRLKVRFSDDARIVQLIQGQAQFSVAKDAGRPFKVEAGTHTVVAVGTVFTVEYIDREMRVAMLEGKVAILAEEIVAPARQASSETVAAPIAREISLSSGEELKVTRAGRATLNPKADLEAATAWRNGKVIFHGEPLSEAVRRLNRYSRLQIEITDPALASMRISGVFEAGDAQAFAEAMQAYLPVTADYSDSQAVRLKPR